jgi:hypothetical protein
MLRAEYDIINQNWKDKKYKDDSEKEALYNKREKKKKEVQKSWSNLRYINRVRKYYNTIEKHADTCGDEDRSAIIEASTTFSLNTLASQANFCKEDQDCQNEEICDLEEKKCVVDIKANREKNEEYKKKKALSKKGKRMLLQATSSDGANKRRKKDKRGPFGGGNKTRKNRRRKNRTRRKNSKNKKKNTKKHRRRKNNTRNTR